MRFFFLVILWWLLAFGVKAQDTLHYKTMADSSKIVHVILYELPQEFKSTAQVNEYYYESKYYKGYSFVLKLRDDCRFIYEIPKGLTIIDRAIGKYHITNDTIFFAYERFSSEELHDTIIQTSVGPVTYERQYVAPLAVSWTLPDRPKYLVIYKDKLYKASKKKLKKREFYTVRGKLQFDIRSRK